MKSIILAVMTVAIMTGSVFARPLTDDESTYVQTNFTAIHDMLVTLLPYSDASNKFVADSIVLTCETNNIVVDSAACVALGEQIKPQLDEMLSDKRKELHALIDSLMDWKIDVLINQ